MAIPLTTAAELEDHLAAVEVAGAPTGVWSKPMSVAIIGDKITEAVYGLPHFAVDVSDVPEKYHFQIVDNVRKSYPLQSWTSFATRVEGRPGLKLLVIAAKTISDAARETVAQVVNRGVPAGNQRRLKALAVMSGSGITITIRVAVAPDPASPEGRLFVAELTRAVTKAYDFEILGISLKPAIHDLPEAFDVVLKIPSETPRDQALQKLAANPVLKLRMVDGTGTFGGTWCEASVSWASPPPAPVPCGACKKVGHAIAECPTHLCSHCGRTGAAAFECATSECCYCSRCPILPGGKGRHASHAMVLRHESKCERYRGSKPPGPTPSAGAKRRRSARGRQGARPIATATAPNGSEKSARAVANQGKAEQAAAARASWAASDVLEPLDPLPTGMEWMYNDSKGKRRRVEDEPGDVGIGSSSALDGADEV